MTGGSASGRPVRRSHRRRPVPRLLRGGMGAGRRGDVGHSLPAGVRDPHPLGRRPRVRALTAVTLVAGFASTVFAPLTALLARRRVLAQHLPPARHPARRHHPAALVRPQRPWRLSPPLRLGGATRPRLRHAVSRAEPSEFWLLVVAFTLAGFCIYAVVVNLVPLLTDGGLTVGEAAVALGIGGAGQVAGRLVYAPAGGEASSASAHDGGSRCPAPSRPSPSLCPLVAAPGLRCVVRRRHGSRDLHAHPGNGCRGPVGHPRGRRPDRRSFRRRQLAASAFAPWLGTLLAELSGGFTTAFVVLAGCAFLAAALSSLGRTTGLLR